jgi:signal transduction histidine kinase
MDDWFHATITSIPDGIAIATQIITERKQAEEAMKKSNEALQKSIEMKDEFFSIISHEFKTPLTVINSAVQAMRRLCRDELSNNANKYLSSILQNSNRQLKLVNNLLDITRINAGSLKIKSVNIDIIKMTREITESIMVFAEQKMINLSFSSTLKKKIIGIDEERYERILLNLLSNAIKFTPESKLIFVQVSKKVISGKCNVCIQVKDHGIGIPQDKLQLIFERFGQVDSSLSRQAEGSGIGLSLVKMLVEMMDGEISVESEVGKGSTFTVLFPDKKQKDASTGKIQQEVIYDRLIQATAIEFSDIY